MDFGDNLAKASRRWQSKRNLVKLQLWRRGVKRRANVAFEPVDLLDCFSACTICFLSSPPAVNDDVNDQSKQGWLFLLPASRSLHFEPRTARRDKALGRLEPFNSLQQPPQSSTRMDDALEASSSSPSQPEEAPQQLPSLPTEILQGIIQLALSPLSFHNFRERYDILLNFCRVNKLWAALAQKELCSMVPDSLSAPARHLCGPTQCSTPSRLDYSQVRLLLDQ